VELGRVLIKNGPRRIVLRPRARIDENENLFRRFAGLGTGIPLAALLFASLPGLLLATVFLGESRKSERKADGQGEKGQNGFHGASPLRTTVGNTKMSASGLNLLKLHLPSAFVYG
jgi:hypothetical protein